MQVCTYSPHVRLWWSITVPPAPPACLAFCLVLFCFISVSPGVRAASKGPGAICLHSDASSATSCCVLQFLLCKVWRQCQHPPCRIVGRVKWANPCWILRSWILRSSYHGYYFTEEWIWGSERFSGVPKVAQLIQAAVGCLASHLWNLWSVS